MTRAGGHPFGVAATPDGRWAFVTVPAAGRDGSAVQVWRLTGRNGRNGRDGRDGRNGPTLIRSIPVPGLPLGATITPDGRYLLAADGHGAVVISVARAEAGTADAVVGQLAAPAGPGGFIPPIGSAPARRISGLPGSAIEVAVSPAGRFAFVTLEYANLIAVFNLAAAVRSGFGGTDYVGAIPLGQTVVGMAVAPDGHWLYATSEVAAPGQHVAGLAGPARAASARAADCPGTLPGERPGTLSVISLRRAETDPAGSVLATVRAGYQPVRVITTDGGTWLWVTARASDDLLCFSAARLTRDPARALVAIVRVGEAPVGLAAVRGGTLLVAADSNRYSAAGARSGLTVVNVAAALDRRHSVVGRIPAGRFPRDMSLSPDGTLLVPNFDSGQLESVSTATLPESAH